MDTVAFQAEPGLRPAKSGATWVVLGASSAIARAFAAEAARAGCGVVLAGRGAEDLERDAADLRIRYRIRASVLHFDATNYDAHQNFVRDCREAAAGTINLFVAFGSMPPQSVMEADFRIARRMIDATYVGVVSALTAFLPVFEAQRAGKVIVIGSVAGDRGRLKNFTYGSAKAGVHAYVQGYRARLAKFGVDVVTVKPGFIDTAMTWGEPGLFLVASPAKCASACYALAAKGRLNAYVPGFWRPIMTIIRMIPERIFRRLPI